MSFSVYLAGPVHIEALESRLRKHGVEMSMPTEADLNESTSLAHYYQTFDSRGFQMHDSFGAARIDPKGFISQIGHRCTWLAHLAAEMFDTYVLYDSEIYTQEGDPPLKEDEDRDCWWRLQSRWETQAYEARVREFAADVRFRCTRLAIQPAGDGFLKSAR
jgi:hypothetical protein